MIFALDKQYPEDPYPVSSAFNGAVLYPIARIKNSGARYHAGAAGQTCEHIGFNEGLAQKGDPTPFVNPKWTMRLVPVRPGGPTGKRFFVMWLSMMVEPAMGLLTLVDAFLFTSTHMLMFLTAFSCVAKLRSVLHGDAKALLPVVSSSHDLKMAPDMKSVPKDFSV